MTPKKNDNYTLFFHNLQSFYIEHGFAEPSMFKGVPIAEINTLENELNLKFPPCVTSYLEVFGGGINIPHFKAYSVYTFNGIKYAYKALQEIKEDGRDITNEILSIEKLDCLVLDKLEKHLEYIVLLNYYLEGDCFTFVEGYDSNPYIYFFFVNADDIMFLCSRLTEHIRGVFSNQIISFCRENAWNRENKVIKSLLQLEWVQYYEMLEENDDFWRHQPRYRTEFRYYYQEDLNDVNIDFSAGEERFLNYLFEKKII